MHNDRNLWYNFVSIGGGELSYKDKQRLPYTEAVLSETLRIGNISPTGIPHRIVQDFTVQGKVSDNSSPVA